MRGQYRIVSELVLFGLGIMITSYVILNFSNVQDSLKEISVADQMENIADVVSTAIVKVANTENSSIRMVIPDRVSDSIYRISIKDADGGKIIVNTIDGRVFVERQLFNINYDNIVDSNGIINNSEVVSTAQFIEVIKNEKITIRRVSTNSSLAI